MLYVQTCIANYSEHYKHMSYAHPLQDEGLRALGMALMLEREKKFIPTMQKRFCQVFPTEVHLTFNYHVLMKALIVIKTIFNVLSK